MADSALVELEGIRKSFGPVTALDDVDLRLHKREIHGLLGGNGAGKTTLMNVLYGLYRPDAGRIRVRGRPVQIDSPSDAIRHGVGMVHQHFLQITDFNVTENIVLGSDLPQFPTLRLDRARERIAELSARFGLEVDPEANVGQLPMGVRQRVEILKALYRGVDVLILDEPTTNLTPHEVDQLFESLRSMVEEGMSVLFITHKLREVMNVCDRVSVLRDGQHILTSPIEGADEETLVASMVGERVKLEDSLLFSGVEIESAAERRAEPRLEVEGLATPGDGGLPAVSDVTFDVHPGEIFGFAGVAGNGQRELAEALLGIRAKSAAAVRFSGEEVSDLPTAEILARGVAYVPEDRVSDGYLPTVTVAHNLILGTHRAEPYARRGVLDWPRIHRGAHELIADYNIQTPGPRSLAANLSGGNIQRTMIARAFSRPIELLLAHNMTSGLDIPSVEAVYQRLLQRRTEGLAVVLLSDDLDELLLLCDRIAVLYRGRIVGQLERPQFDRYDLGRMMSGAGLDG